MNPKLKTALIFVGSVIAALFAIRLFQTYVLPKAPDAVKSAADKILPKT